MKKQDTFSEDLGEKQSQKEILSILVAAKLDKPLSYINATGLTLQPGKLVRVPMGKRILTGIVLGESQTIDADISKKLKRIDSAVSSEYQIPADLRNLILWSARYYHAPIGQVLSTALPKSLLEGKPVEPKTQVSWQLTDTLHDQKLPKRQHQLYLWLKKTGSASTTSVLNAGFGRHLLQALLKKSLLKTVTEEPNTDGNVLAEQPKSANEEQQQALQKISENTGAFLLQGVTGSGKTEVYMQAMLPYLENGRQVLLLVPEIGLISQTLERIKARFNVPVLGYHSAATESEKILCWKQAAKQSALIVVGTRSAIFLPFADLAITFVDEEQDQSYKQQEGFRYNARDLAAYRSNQLSGALVLGSATPSLESLKNVANGHYKLLQLNQRTSNNPLPEWQFFQQPSSSIPISEVCLEQILKNLNSGGQVLVYLNRRGYAPLLRCESCGWQALCKSCDTRMTLHRQPEGLICHRCNLHKPIPQACPVCKSTKISSVGVGTEQLESFFQTHFPDTPCIRIDRDSTQRKQAFQQGLQELKSGQPAILVGTQMITKGHHLPGISLVVCLGVDSALYSHDFRALENIIQTLIQVAGRAGRGEKPGQIIVETGTPEHPAFLQLATRSYSEIAEDLLKRRRAQKLPPYGNCAIFHANSPELKQLTKFMETCYSSIGNNAVDFIGPMPSPVERKGGKYRYQIQLYSENRSKLHTTIATLENMLKSLRGFSKVRWGIDVDPLSID